MTRMYPATKEVRWSEPPARFESTAIAVNVFSVTDNDGSSVLWQFDQTWVSATSPCPSLQISVDGSSWVEGGAISLEEPPSVIVDYAGIDTGTATLWRIVIPPADFDFSPNFLLPQSGFFS